MSSTVPVFDPASPQAEAIQHLFVQVLLISAGIFAIVAGLVCTAIWRFRNSEKLPDQDFGSHKKEIAWMVGPVLVVLWLAAISTKLILTLNAAPPMYASDSDVAEEARRIDLVVTGHQWWWEIEYPDGNVVSANEIHIPVGKKLRVAIRSDDVIHCFWVAQLTRKMDAIPGRENFVWLEASRPGVFQGRCAEYCGTQHAWMNFLVIAHEPSDYERWLAGQQGAPAAPDAQQAIAGAELFQKLTCSQCHTVGGTPAEGRYAPDLTHVASRRQLGAGVIENTPENMRRWLEDPQAMKPGCKMPNFKLEPQQLDQLVAFFETLK